MNSTIISMKTGNQGRRCGGFTLIELLVGIGIVAVLAALIFPAVTKSREQAMSATCVGNLRQIGIGILTYVNDNNGYLPAPTYSTMWDEKLVESGALTDTKITRRGCPKSKPFLFGTYGYNYLQLGGFDFPAGKMSSIEIPRETIMVADTHNYGSPTPMSSYQQYNLVYWDNTFWSGQYKPIGHLGNVNVLWADNHVSPLKINKVIENNGHPVANYYFRRLKDKDWPYNDVAPW